jgi:hypothetical protein
MAVQATTTAPAKIRPSLSTLAAGGDVRFAGCTFRYTSAKETSASSGDDRTQMWREAEKEVSGAPIARIDGVIPFTIDDVGTLRSALESSFTIGVAS